ncbi:uncharacterized protein METZ01_LOCUS161134, partial [marine metagenome]
RGKRGLRHPTLPSSMLCHRSPPGRAT